MIIDIFTPLFFLFLDLLLSLNNFIITIFIFIFYSFKINIKNEIINLIIKYRYRYYTLIFNRNANPYINNTSIFWGGNYALK